MFFEHADCLVGVCKDVTTLSSQLLTISLNDFGDVPAGADDALASPAASVTSKSPAGSSGRKRKVVEKPQPRRTKLQSVGELLGEEDDNDDDDSDEGAGEEKGALEHE
jgi:hypothetical protein